MAKRGNKGTSPTKAARLATIHAPKAVEQAKNAADVPTLTAAPEKPSKAATKPIPKAEKPQRISPPPIEKPASRPRWFWAAIVQFPLLILSIASNIVTVLGPVWPTAPIFSPSYPSAASPFEVPFSIENKSSLFPLNNIRIRCVIKDVVSGIGHNRVSDVTLTHEIQGQSIKPSSSNIYTCPFNHFISMPNDFIAYAKIQFEYRYDTIYPFYLKSHEESTGVFWLNTKVVPPRWEQNEPLM